MAQRTTDYEPILALLREGWGPAHIIETLGLSLTRRHIQRIAVKHGIDRSFKGSGRLDEDGIGTGSFRDVVMHGMVDIRGLDPHLCAQCGKRQEKVLDIHHTKYEGATLYDLEFVCRRCNLAPRNMGLA